MKKAIEINPTYISETQLNQLHARVKGKYLNQVNYDKSFRFCSIEINLINKSYFNESSTANES